MMVNFNFVFILVASFFCNDANAEANPEPGTIINQIIIKHSQGKGLHEECKTTSECETLHAECIDNKCVCAEEYREVDGKCIEKIALNSPCVFCEENPPCADRHAECFEGFCTCKQGYTDTDGVCIADTPPEGEMKGPCLENGNCTADNSVCIGGMCECLRTFVSVGPDCIPEKNYEERCNYRAECPEDMFCNCDNVCTCKGGYVFTSEFTCEKISHTGESCSSSQQCGGTHTKCIGDRCACQPLYGPSIHDPTDCVPKTTTLLFGPVPLDNETLPYKPEYSDLNSTTFMVEAGPIINEIKEIFVEVLDLNGLVVKEMTVFAVDSGDDGGSNVTFIVTLYNPDYDRETKSSRIASTAETTSNEQILQKTESALQTINSIRKTFDVKPVSQLGELCDDNSHCDILGANCVDKACVCDNGFDEAGGACI